MSESLELFHKILKAAVDGGASDVHIKIGYPIIFRINSELVDVETQIPTKEWIDEVLELAVPPYAKVGLEKNHETDFSYYVEGVGRFRTNVFQQRGSYAFAMRYVKAEVPSLDGLRLPDILRKIADSPRGIVLVAGTTGSGKSTTLAAMLDHINSNSRRHIITLEDPIEYVFSDKQSVIEQREIGLDTPSFAGGLKHVLRQDPDVIMIGEMRDATSFQAAISAADTGHLVLSTLHTTDTSQSVGRILDFFEASDREQVRKQLVGTLKAVICQRMVRTADGGIYPAMEIMISNSTIRKLIEENRLDKLAAAVEIGREDGMQTFNQALFDLVQNGIITKEEALNKATNAQALEMNFKGIFLDEGKKILG